jgi:hypothetical protein
MSDMGAKRLSSLFAFAVLTLLLWAPVVLAERGGDMSQDETADTIAGVGLKALLVIVVCAVLAFLIALSITFYICYFMYTDAEARGQNGLLWAIIGFFGGLLGLIIWLCIRPELKQKTGP